MLDKISIHLKNIIFFKVIIYVIVIILLFSLLPILQEEYTKSISKKEQARSFLSQALLKLDSIVDFEEKIWETNNSYLKLIKNSDQNECKLKTKLFKEFDAISKQYQLSQPITMEITSLQSSADSKVYSDKVVMREDRLDLDFSAPSVNGFLEISQAITKILPIGSILLTTDIKKCESLSVNIISMLSENKKPDLYKAKIKIKLRQVVYEK